MELGLALSMVQKKKKEKEASIKLGGTVGKFTLCKNKSDDDLRYNKRTDRKVSRVYRVEREGCVVLISITHVFLLWSQHKPRIAL